MVIGRIDQLTNSFMPPPAVGSGGGGRASSFADYLSEARNTFGHDKVDSSEDVLREGAEELVATAFLKPIFKMMREDPLRSDILPVSKGEKLFGPMLDAQMAKQITDQSHYSLVDAVVRSLTRGTKAGGGSESESSDDVHNDNKKSVLK